EAHARVGSRGGRSGGLPGQPDDRPPRRWPDRTLALRSAGGARRRPGVRARRAAREVPRGRVRVEPGRGAASGQRDGGGARPHRRHGARRRPRGHLGGAHRPRRPRRDPRAARVARRRIRGAELDLSARAGHRVRLPRRFAVGPLRRRQRAGQRVRQPGRRGVGGGERRIRRGLRGHHRRGGAGEPPRSGRERLDQPVR
ncbi:MAG: hypothetical protein AVDCRST_MAG40-341, partial [uncultured Gemmatimonadaceae bacterium]